jgi:hypothetical protein
LRLGFPDVLRAFFCPSFLICRCRSSAVFSW